MPLVTGPGNMQGVEIPDMVGGYARMQQLRQMQAEAPYRAQILQQQAQQGPLDIQQKQIDLEKSQRALQDQKAMDAAMQQWAQPKQPAAAGIPAAQGTQAAAGVPTAQTTSQAPAQPSYPDYDKLADLAQQNGASYDTVSKLRQHAVDMRDKATQIAMDAAKTGQDTANTMKTQNTARISALSGVANLPDEQLVPGLQAATQYMNEQGLLDAQHLPIYQQILQSGDPATIRKQLGMQITSMGGFNQLLDDAQKKIETDQKRQTADWYKQHGTTPGISVEEQQMASWLDQNKGKTPADYVQWKAQNSPSVIVQNMGNQSMVPGANGQTDWGKTAAKFGLTPQALDQAAETYFRTGQLPPGRGVGTGAAMNKAIMNRANDLHSGESFAANSAEFKANTASLNKLQTNFDQVSAFENTAGKNLDLYLEKLKAIPDLQAKFLNTPMRLIDAKMIGSDNYQAMKAAQQTAASESAKVLASSNASGVLSDSQKKEAEDMLSGNLSYSAAQKVVATLRQDFANRHESYQNQITDIKGRLGGGGPQGSTGNSGGAAAGGVTVTAPNDRTYSFKDQAAADAFKAKAGIK